LENRYHSGVFHGGVCCDVFTRLWRWAVAVSATCHPGVDVPPAARSRSGKVLRALALLVLLVQVLGLGFAASAHAQDGGWRIQNVTTRTGPAGRVATVSLSIAVPREVAARHILLYVSSFNAPQITPNPRVGRIAPVLPWSRVAPLLNTHGVVMVTADIPSDANRRSVAERPLPEVTADIRAVMLQLEQDFPGLPIHLAGFGQDAGELVLLSQKLPTVGRMVFVNADFRNYRAFDWSALNRPVMVLQAPGSQCDYVSYTDAAMVAQRNGFRLVQAGYPRAERNNVCGRGSQNTLEGLEAQTAQVIAQWLDGQEPPSAIGHSPAALAWREQVMRYNVPESLGAQTREISILYPEGPGPFPVTVFNHGDVLIEHPQVRYRQRMVDMVVAREFLQVGWAVAFPARRGVGLSDGVYTYENVLDDFNPTYKAQVHAKEILPVLDFLKQLPLLDTSRVVLSGQSAGGYAVMQMATQNLPGVIGLVNFSGGRTDVRGIDGKATAGYVHEKMVNGFAEFGKATPIHTLWIFAENDSRYSAATVRAAHKAFTDAGGKATLLLYSSLEPMDGHFIYQLPQLWRGILQSYLRAIQAPKTTGQ
jgi:dienelactone hydrolase